MGVNSHLIRAVCSLWAALSPLLASTSVAAHGQTHGEVPIAEHGHPHDDSCIPHGGHDSNGDPIPAAWRTSHWTARPASGVTLHIPPAAPLAIFMTATDSGVCFRLTAIRDSADRRARSPTVPQAGDILPRLI